MTSISPSLNTSTNKNKFIQNSISVNRLLESRTDSGINEIIKKIPNYIDDKYNPLKKQIIESIITTILTKSDIKPIEYTLLIKIYKNLLSQALDKYKNDKNISFPLFLYTGTLTHLFQLTQILFSKKNNEMKGNNINENNIHETNITSKYDFIVFIVNYFEKISNISNSNSINNNNNINNGNNNSITSYSGGAKSSVYSNITTNSNTNEVSKKFIQILVDGIKYKFSGFIDFKGKKIIYDTSSYGLNTSKRFNSSTNLKNLNSTSKGNSTSKSNSNSSKYMSKETYNRKLEEDHQKLLEKIKALLESSKPAASINTSAKNAEIEKLTKELENLEKKKESSILEFQKKKEDELKALQNELQIKGDNLTKLQTELQNIKTSLTLTENEKNKKITEITEKITTLSTNIEKKEKVWSSNQLINLKK